jgi:hypothetical protein
MASRAESELGRNLAPPKQERNSNIMKKERMIKPGPVLWHVQHSQHSGADERCCLPLREEPRLRPMLTSLWLAVAVSSLAIQPASAQPWVYSGPSASIPGIRMTLTVTPLNGTYPVTAEVHGGNVGPYVEQPPGTFDPATMTLNNDNFLNFTLCGLPGFESFSGMLTGGALGDCASRFVKVDTTVPTFAPCNPSLPAFGVQYSPLNFTLAPTWPACQPPPPPPITQPTPTPPQPPAPPSVPTTFTLCVGSGGGGNTRVNNITLVWMPNGTWSGTATVTWLTASQTLSTTVVQLAGGPPTGIFSPAAGIALTVTGAQLPTPGLCNVTVGSGNQIGCAFWNMPSIGLPGPFWLSACH